MLRIALTFIQFFSALAIVGLVMLQRGKGAEAGAGFGAGASGTVFGARGAGTALSRATAIFTVVFMLNSLVLGYVGSHQTEQPKSIFDTAGQTQQPAPHPALPPVSEGKPVPAPRSSPTGASGANQGGAAAPAGGAAPSAPSSRTVPAPAPPAGK
ncbi:MAG TPA: preprotein translocase subunit SecG [Steroidobacteraceae bacterium]|nr:preprotein translocase subunit SecG [Steroidobacteraceae bacterium]